MNKIKKLVSLTLIISLLILSSLTVLAVNSNGDYIGVEVSSDTVKVGETVQAWVYAYDNDGDAVITTKESATIYMTFDKAGFEVKEVKYIAGSGEKLTTNADDIKYLGMGLSADVSLAKSAKFMLVEFTALKEGTYNFSILEESGQGEILYWNAGDLLEDTDGEILPAVSVTVTAAQQEEVFEASVTENTSTSVTLFAKNLTGEKLVAGTYGFDFGGARFPVGIAAGSSAAQDCPIGGSFAVKLEDANGKFLETGKVFSYSAYYNSGATTTTPTTVTIGQ